MVRLSNEELQRIISEQLPGQKLARREPDISSPDAASFDAGSADYTANRAHADAEMPDLDTLKRKYQGIDADVSFEASSVGAPTDEEAARDATETEFIVTTSEDDADTWDRGPGPKAHLVDENGNIVAHQG